MIGAQEDLRPLMETGQNQGQGPRHVKGKPVEARPDATIQISRSDNDNESVPSAGFDDPH